MTVRRTPASPSSRLGVGYTRYSTEEQGSTAEQRAINEMIAADHDRRFHLSGPHQMVDALPERGALAVPKPADSCR
mgnify:CR=1 FL=1